MTHTYKYTIIFFGALIILFSSSRVFPQTLSNDELIRSAFVASANGNLAEAFNLIEVAAKLEDRRAEFLLGDLYENGDYPNALTVSIKSSGGPTHFGREGDIQTAVTWYRKAATKGLPEAQAKMGCFFETSPFSPEEGYKWAQAGAAQNNAEAIACLAVMHFFGVDDLTGVRMAPRNKKKALALFEKAANAGEPLAQEYLADLYWMGTLDGTFKVQIDKPRAIELYKRAAEGGKPASMKRLKEIYSSGDGVEKDPVMAYVWGNLEANYMGWYEYIPKELTPELAIIAKQRLTLIKARNLKGIAKYRANPHLYPQLP